MSDPVVLRTTGIFFSLTFIFLPLSTFHSFSQPVVPLKSNESIINSDKLDPSIWKKSIESLELGNQHVAIENLNNSLIGKSPQSWELVETILHWRLRRKNRDQLRKNVHEYGIANQCTINPQKSVCKNLKDFWKKSLGLYFFRKSQTLVVKAHQAIKLGKCTEASRLTSQAKNLEGRHNEILELERLYGQCIGQFELTREQYELNMKWTNIF